MARGRNRLLAGYLLEQGSTPEHCLWAAAYGGDMEMLRLLIDAGASLDAIAEAETPLLHAVKYSKFKAAEVLLDAGSDPDFQDVSGMTALHYMLKKGSRLPHFSMFVRHGAHGDIANFEGETAADMLRRKRDPAFRKIADELRRG